MMDDNLMSLLNKFAKNGWSVLFCPTSVDQLLQMRVTTESGYRMIHTFGFAESEYLYCSEKYLVKLLEMVETSIIKFEKDNNKN